MQRPQAIGQVCALTGFEQKVGFPGINTHTSRSGLVQSRVLHVWPPYGPTQLHVLVAVFKIPPFKQVNLAEQTPLKLKLIYI